MPRKKNGAATAKAAATAASAPEQAKGGASKPAMSKADFIRSQPAHLSAKEVIARAKAAGIKVGENYVYALRPAGRKPAKAKKAAPVAKATAKKAATKNRTAPVATPAPAASRASSSDAEFARLVLNLGFERVDALLARIKKTLGSVAAGA